MLPALSTIVLEPITILIMMYYIFVCKSDKTRQDKIVGACDDVSCNVKYGLKIAMLTEYGQVS